jgi:hypothetical protein
MAKSKRIYLKKNDFAYIAILRLNKPDKMAI